MDGGTIILLFFVLLLLVGLGVLGYYFYKEREKNKKNRNGSPCPVGSSPTGPIYPTGSDTFGEVVGGVAYSLMTKITQSDNNGNIPESKYKPYYFDALWIEGVSEGAPKTKAPVYDLNVKLLTESVDWSKYMSKDKKYRLRQTVYDSSNLVYDASWSFTYPGYVTQNAAPANTWDAKTWALSDRVIYTDTTNILWDQEDKVWFYLPFKTGLTGNIASAWWSRGFENFNDWVNNVSQRRSGSAGIAGSAADSKDPAFGVAPFFPTYHSNMLWVHQANDKFGNNAKKNFTLLYWIGVDN